MKKLLYLTLAFALVVVLSQCKKKVETISSVPASVYITLDVDGGDKVIVDPYHSPTYASVTFEQGDVIYVGNNGAYCGYLTHDGTKFGGNITPNSANDADYLHFYFMGNKGPIGSAPTSVNISDQTQKYPVISYGRSIQMYNSSTTSYSTTLYNKCSIMRFPIAGAGTDKAVTITGMKNVVAVDFSANSTGSTANPYSYSMNGNGAITLHSENINEKWAIVLPQDAVKAQLQADGYYKETLSVPAISTNEYHNDDIGEITLTAFAQDLFSVSDTTRVRFSPGNLQYTRSTGTWSFMEHQYDMVETLNQDVGTNYADQDIVSLFGWGTGDNPTNTSDDNGQYGTFNDWGVYNRIYNPSTGNTDAPGTWRTLTYAEWRYVLYDRTTPSGIRYAKATVNNVSGVILLPDDWNAGTYNLSSTNTYGANFSSNIIPANAWPTLEDAGAVFLPAAGYRDGTTVYVAGSNGNDWSASPDGSTLAYSVYFDDGNLNPGYHDNRFLGLSVRLVEDMN